MRIPHFTRIAGALMLLTLSSYVAAQERITLRIADQKGGMRSQLEAANALQNLAYDIKWAEFPAAAPLAEALNAGAVDVGIIGDAPLLFALANGAPVKAIAVDKSNPAGTAVLVPPGSALKSAADLKGKRIATGKGSIGHFVALKALEQAGVSPKEVQWVFLGPVDAKVALLNGSVDAWATWEPYTTQLVKTAEGQILVSGKGLLPGNTFLAATDNALKDPQKRAGDIRREANNLPQRFAIAIEIGISPTLGAGQSGEIILKRRALLRILQRIIGGGQEGITRQQPFA
ncbi:aliphatic sulfonate ABC transporter substrate-binding protein, partial [Klebsiella aerogenes]|uniref:aliphatic sulfonate ABC transporter substrate-binding protein n=1 Tax=Klebsiella aerogenes TaxID=548 RepID=UPI000AE116D4